MAALSQEQVARLLYQAGFTGDAVWKLLAIAGRESGYDPRAVNRGSGDRGLWQINPVHYDTLKDQHIIRRPDDLLDPMTNARAAFYLSGGGTDEGTLRQLWGADESGWVGRSG